VVWQRTSPGTLAATSAIGEPSSSEIALPEELLVREGENVIVAEVFYGYTPFIFGDLFDESVFYHRAFNRPRIINLTSVDPS
jgi:hypothetical protein